MPIWKKTFAMPLVISDASTLIHLAGIGRLDLLKAFYGRVVFPAVM
jgi:predicted nucleic acid-binding protein